MSPGPSLVLVLPFEGRPRVYVDALTEGELRRLADWLAAAERPLAQRVLEALQEARAALAGEEEAA
jgi:hypothetical protein